MASRILLIGAVLCAAGGCARSSQLPQLVARAPGEESRIAIDYRPSDDGQTLIEIVAEPGAQVEVFDGQNLVARDSAPLVAAVPAGGRYRVRVTEAERAREQELGWHAGQIARARFELLEPPPNRRPPPAQAEKIIGIAFYLFPVVKAVLSIK